MNAHVQITAQAAFHLATLEMTNNNRKRRESLDNIMELIVATKVTNPPIFLIYKPQIPICVLCNFVAIYMFKLHMRSFS